jgi:hypothetical protein
VSGRVVEVRIDELALEGVGPLDRDRVAEAASREITRLLGERGDWAGGAVAVDVGAASLEPRGGAPEDLGSAIGRAVHGQLAR